MSGRTQRDSAPRYRQAGRRENYGGGGSRLHFAAYRLFLKAYPASFRQTYGSQMLQHFSDLLRHRYPDRPARVWTLVVPDLVMTSLFERKESVMHRASVLKAVLPLLVVALGLSLIVGGANPTAMAKVFGIAVAGMAVLGGLAFFASRRLNRPVESDSAGRLGRNWWTFPAGLLGLFYLVVVGRQLVDTPTAGSLVSLLVALGFAGLIVAGLILRSRERAPLGNWLVIFGCTPGLAFFWFPPALALGSLAIIGSLSEVISSRTRSNLA